MNPSIKNYYDDKTVLLTGTTGFVGKVILEKTLRSLNNVKQVILFMRPKKGISAYDRFLQTTLISPLFDPLKEQLGQNFEEFIAQKIKVIEGDLLADNLGMKSEDRQYIIENCNIIVNCAASIDFNALLIDSINTNIKGSLRMFNLAKECKQLDNFVHVSTAYVNSDKTGFIEERIYDVQYDPHELLSQISKIPASKLEAQTPAIIGKFPNTYTFTKSLVERILKKEKPENFSLTIVRPSIVGSTCKEPFKGWVENLAASTAVFAFAGLGIVKSITSQEDMIGDIVPVDYVANYVLAGAALFANRNEINICHACTSAQNPMIWKYPKNYAIKYWQQNPPEKNVGEADVKFFKTMRQMRIYTNITQKYPAIAHKKVAEWIGGPKMIKDSARQNKILDRAISIQELFSYFSGNEWIFDNKMAQQINSNLSTEEKEIFWLDQTQIDWKEYLIFYSWGIQKFIFKEAVPVPSVSQIILASSKTYFSDIQWALENGKNFSTRPQSQYKSMVLNSQKVIEELNNLIESRIQQQQGQVKSHKQVSIEKIKAQCKQDALDLANEMMANYKMGVLRVLAWSVHKIFRQIYEKVHIDDLILRQISHHDEKLDGPIVFIPTHRSYIDFIIVSYILFAFKIQCPHIAAAEDFLKMAIVPHFLRMSGAFFLRRKLAEDLQPLYKTMLYEYMTRLLMDNCFIEFFIEGTRSRNFKTLSPKFGLLGTVVDAVCDQKIDNALIIPLTINYEKVLEEDTYPYELMGEEKVKESTMRLIKASKVLKENYGKIFVEFCEPISVKQYVSQNSVLPRKDIINQLGYEICYSLQEKLVITVPTIVASILLMHRKGIMEHILVSKVEWLVQKIKERKALIGSITTSKERAGVSQAVRSAILLLESNLTKSKKTVFEMSVAPSRGFKNILMLSYYRNGLHHLFIYEAIYCVALCSFGQKKSKTGVDIQEYWKETQFLLKLLKKEHVSRRKITNFEQFMEFLHIMVGYKVLAYDNETQQVKIEDEQMVNFLCSQCWSIVESYWITSVYFFSLSQNKDHIVREFQLPQYVQWFSENMYDENVLEHMESSSLDQLRNAVSNFKELKIISIDNELNVKNQGVVKLNVSEQQLQQIENQISKFLRKNYIVHSNNSPIDLARRNVLAEYQQFQPKL